MNHLWLAWIQSREIRQTGRPSLFCARLTDSGSFTPTISSTAGRCTQSPVLMIITGAPVAVFVGIIVASFSAAYGGTWWLARQIGVESLYAHLPATIVVTGAYYLSLAYGRGSWPEFVATSAILLVLASGARRHPAWAPSGASRRPGSGDRRLVRKPQHQLGLGRDVPRPDHRHRRSRRFGACCPASTCDAPPPRWESSRSGSSSTACPRAGTAIRGPHRRWALNTIAAPISDLF